MLVQFFKINFPCNLILFSTTLDIFNLITLRLLCSNIFSQIWLLLVLDLFCKIKEKQALCLFYLFSFLLTINLKLIIVHVEIKIVHKEAVTKQSTLLHAQRHHTFEQSNVMLIRKGK